MVPGTRVQKKRHSRLKRLISRVGTGSGRRRINDVRQIRHAQDMFRELAENAMAGVYIGGQGVYRYVNQRMCELTGYTRGELLHEIDILDLFTEQDRQRVRESIGPRSIGATRRTQMQCRIVRKDGALLDVDVFASKMRLGGELVTIGPVIDNPDRKRAEAASRMAALVYQHSSDAMVVTDAAGFIESVNPAFSGITGYRDDEVVGRKISILGSGRHNNAFYQALWKSIDETGSWQGDIWSRRKNGDEYAQRLTVNTSFDEQGNVCNRIAVFSAIASKKTDDAKQWQQANYDHLTGLPNRPLLHDRLAHAIARSKRSELTLALIFIDLDHFKDLNDRFGHDMGDELLRQAAQRLSAVVRATDTVARLSGDEFVIVVGEVRHTDVVHRICRAISTSMAEPFILGESSATLSASVGVALYPDNTTDATTLLQLANLAMYASKDKGRNQYGFFRSDMQEGALVRRQLLRDLGLALDEGQFHLEYQPIVDMKTGRIRKAEALLRWAHPVLGLISPMQFIPMAEDTGVIDNVGSWVFREAIRQAALWQSIADPDFQMSINLSPAQFQQQGLDVKAWLIQLQELGLAGRDIVVEITEKLLNESTPLVQRQMKALRDCGIQVALDDFGAEYASQPQLEKFGIDYIKIDRSFVTHVACSTDDLARCEAIVAMAHKLGLKVVAEGVETDVQHALMLSAGCDLAQGYLYAKPMQAAAFEQLLMARQDGAPDGNGSKKDRLQEAPAAQERG